MLEILEYKEIIENKKEAEIPAIYFLINRKNEIVYVGQSKNPVNRIATHIGSRKWFTHYYYFHCDYETMDELEAFYILKFKPRYNNSIPHNNRFLSKAKVTRWFKQNHGNHITGMKLRRKLKELRVPPLATFNDLEYFDVLEVESILRNHCDLTMPL